MGMLDYRYSTLSTQTARLMQNTPIQFLQLPPNANYTPHNSIPQRLSPQRHISISMQVHNKVIPAKY